MPGNNITPIDLNKLHEITNIAIEKAKDVKDKTPILFVGNTGAGKSTTINLIDGRQMEAIDDGLETRLCVVGKPVVEIGDGIESKTLYPQIIESGQLVMADLPGFGENREIEKKLCAAGGVIEVINSAKSIRGIVVVIDYPSLVAIRSEGFANVVQTFSELLKSPGTLNENERQAISFVLTKVPADRTKVQIRKGLTTLKTKYEETLKKPNADKDETQKQLDVLNLIQENNLLIIQVDGKGYAPDSNELLELDQNKQAIIKYLSQLPGNSLSSDNFQLTKPTSTVNAEVRYQNARVKLHMLATLKDNEFCPAHIKDKLTDEDKIVQNLHDKLRKIEVAIKTNADGYLKSSRGETFDTEKSFKQLKSIHDEVIKIFSTSPSVSLFTLEHIIKTVNYLCEFSSAIKILFKNDLINDEIVLMIDNLRRVQNTIQLHVALESVNRIIADSETINNTLLHVHKSFEDSLTRLATLENDKTALISQNNNTRNTLNTDLTNKQQAITNLGARPGLAAAPGNAPPVSPHPGSNAPPEPGTEPHVPPHPGDPPSPAPAAFIAVVTLGAGAATYAVQWGIWKGQLDAFHAAEREHGAWSQRRDAYNNYHAVLNAHNTSNTAFQAWQTAQNAYNASVTAQATYDTNLATATSARDAAQLALTQHDHTATQQLNAKNAGITAEKNVLHNVKILRLLVIGANSSLNAILDSPQRSNAIAIYKMVIDKLKPSKNNLPANVIENLEITLDKLHKENTYVTALYQSVVNSNEEAQRVVFEKDKSFADQLNLLITDLQEIIFSYEKDISDFTEFSQQLLVCDKLISLDLKRSGFDKSRLSILLPVVMHLTKLQKIDFSQSKLDDVSALNLLALIYAHPSLIELNLEGNNVSPVLMQLINGLLTLKQDLTNAKDVNINQKLDEYVSFYLHSYELLSIASDDKENREFEISVSKENVFTATHNAQSGKQQFVSYLDEIKARRDKLKLESYNTKSSAALFSSNTVAAKPAASSTATSAATVRTRTAFFKLSDSTKPFFNHKRTNSWEQSTHWYTNGEIEQLLDNLFGADDHVELFTPLSAEQFQGVTLADNLYDRLTQHVYRESLGLSKPVHIVLPVNIGNNHWVALYINLNNREKSMVTYVDPFGNPMPKEINTAIKNVFPALLDTNIIISPVRLQNDGYNCGPWVVESLKYIVFKGGLPEGLDINQARREHQNVLRNPAPANPTVTKAM